MATIQLKCPNCSEDIEHTVTDFHGDCDNATYDSTRVPERVADALTPDYVTIACSTCWTDFKVKESKVTYKRIYLVEAD